MIVARSFKGCADRTVIIRQRSDQPVEVVELVQNCQTATALSAGDSDQNFMAGFCDINSHQNRLALCNNGVGHSRSPLQCGLLQNHCRDLRPGYDHLLRYLEAAQAIIALKPASFRRCYGPEFTSRAIMRWADENTVP